MATERDHRQPVSFSVDGNALTVRDELENQALGLTVDGQPSPRPALTELFPVPLDGAVSVTASTVRVHDHDGSHLWDETGDHLGEFTPQCRTLSRGTYYVQVSGPVTTYLRIADASFSAVYTSQESHADTLVIDVDGDVELAVGARSLHTRPRTTITVPDDPTAIATAVAHLGSSIKEFTCERSWPSVRGHPPAIERGDRLDVPSCLSIPETDITITVPETLADVYRVAPLAFYLGSDVEVDVGARPALHFENGHVEPLETPRRSLEETVDDLLGRCLLLDSLVRVGGYYSNPRFEYERLGADLPFYPPNLYDLPLAEQLLEYLDVPAEVLEPHYPRWPATALVRPDPVDVELLPYLLDRLSRVRVVDVPTSALAAGTAAVGEAALPRTRPTPEAFANALDHRIPERADARFVYVTADADRAERVRSLADDLVLDEAVSVAVARTTDALRRALASASDVLYCDVPVTSSGFVLRDGRLDPEALADVGAQVVGTRGREGAAVALAAVECGARASLATNRPLSVRETIRLFTHLLEGFSLVRSADLAVDVAVDPRFVGDAANPVVRHDVGPPVLVDVESVDADDHRISIRFQPSSHYRLGGISRIVDDVMPDSYQLIGSSAWRTDGHETDDVLALFESDDARAIRVNGRVYRGDDDDPETFLRTSVRRAIGAR